LTIHVCHATRHHILAFEENKDIYDALIAPVLRATMVPKAVSATSKVDLSDEKEEAVVVQNVQKTNRFYK